jgi:hypothetical protein
MFTRRQFLRLLGISASAAAANSLPIAAAAPVNDHRFAADDHFAAAYGRALETVPVYDTPDGQVIRRLWSDTVTPLRGSLGNWYQLPDGYAKRDMLQPMVSPATHTLTPSAPPFWGTVSGAVAVVRAYCAADAPIVARVGHGGVLRAVDFLSGDGLGWYGVAETEGGALLGWTQAAVWSPAPPDSALPTLSLAIDRQAQRLTARDSQRVLLTAPVSAGGSLLPGAYSVTERHASTAQGEYRGVPWALAFSGHAHLTGAYWHNRFGSAAAAPAAAVQVTPALAQWLFPRAAEIIIS